MARLHYRVGRTDFGTRTRVDLNQVRGVSRLSSNLRFILTYWENGEGPFSATVPWESEEVLSALCEMDGSISILMDGSYGYGPTGHLGNDYIWPTVLYIFSDGHLSYTFYFSPDNLPAFPSSLNGNFDYHLEWDCNSMGSTAWTGASNIHSGSSFLLSSTLAVPPIPPTGMVLWHARITITNYPTHLVDWQENSITKRSFGNVILGYHGFYGDTKPILYGNNYLGLFERMPSFAAKTTTDVVNFGIKLTSRTRCDSLHFDFKPGISGILLYSAMLVELGNSEYI